MSWEAWVLVGAYAGAALLTVSQVGKPRKPIEPATAATSLVLTGFFIYLILRLAEVF